MIEHVHSTLNTGNLTKQSSLGLKFEGLKDKLEVLYDALQIIICDLVINTSIYTEFAYAYPTHCTSMEHFERTNRIEIRQAGQFPLLL